MADKPKKGVKFSTADDVIEAKEAPADVGMPAARPKAQDMDSLGARPKSLDMDSLGARPKSQDMDSMPVRPRAQDMDSMPTRPRAQDMDSLSPKPKAQDLDTPAAGGEAAAVRKRRTHSLYNKSMIREAEIVQKTESDSLKDLDMAVAYGQSLLEKLKAKDNDIQTLDQSLAQVKEELEAAQIDAGKQLKTYKTQNTQLKAVNMVMRAESKIVKEQLSKHKTKVKELEQKLEELEFMKIDREREDFLLTEIQRQATELLNVQTKLNNTSINLQRTKEGNQMLASIVEQHSLMGTESEMRLRGVQAFLLRTLEDTLWYFNTFLSECFTMSFVQDMQSVLFEQQLMTFQHSEETDRCLITSKFFEERSAITSQMRICFIEDWSNRVNNSALITKRVCNTLYSQALLDCEKRGRSQVKEAEAEQYSSLCEMNTIRFQNIVMTRNYTLKQNEVAALEELRAIEKGRHEAWQEYHTNNTADTSERLMAKAVGASPSATAYQALLASTRAHSYQSPRSTNSSPVFYLASPVQNVPSSHNGSLPQSSSPRYTQSANVASSAPSWEKLNESISDLNSMLLSSFQVGR